MCSFGRVFRFFKASYNALTSSFIAEQKIRWCNAKRRRQREGKKTLCTSSTLFLISLPLFRTTTAWNFLWVTPFNKDNVACAHKIFCFLCSFLLFFFSIAAHFHLAGRQYFLSSHRRYIIFMLLFQWNSSPLFCISRSSSFSVIHENVD